MTGLTFRRTMQANALLWGNAYGEIRWTNGGQPYSLHPLHPYYMRVYRDTSTENLVYHYIIPPWDATDARPSGSVVDFQPHEILHLPGLSAEGTVGYRPITILRESIVFGVAAQRFGAGYFGKACRPSAVLTTDG